MRKLYSLFLLVATHFSVAQSTDVVKLYILYDISGSTRFSDSNQNLKELVNVLIREEKARSKSPYSFEFIAFGEKAEKRTLNLYEDKGIDKSRQEIIEYLKGITDWSESNRAQKYTHLLAALDTIRKDAGATENFGVFIFADGLLRNNDKNRDVENGDAFTYCDSIRSYINLLQNNRKPVFIIQSSLKRENDYYDINEESLTKTDSFSLSKDFFWLPAEIDFDRKKNKSVAQAFEKFLAQAFFRIQHTNSRRRMDDPIGRFLTLAELLHYYNLASGTRIKTEKPKSSQYFNGLDSLIVRNDDFKKEILLQPPLHIKVKTEQRKSVEQKNSHGGPKQFISLDNIPNIYLLEPPVNVKFNALLNEIANQLDAVRSMSSADLDLLYQKIMALVNYEGFLKVEPFLKEYINKKESALASLVQSATDKLPNFSGGDLPAQFLNYTAPVDNKERNIQEAIILGLTDYLIKRTKQEALFLSFETLNKHVFEPSSFVRDTLFYHTAKLLGTLDPKNDSHFEPNLVLIKEAFNQDMDFMSTSIIKHPKVHSSNGLVSLLYTTELINNLSKGNTLTESFKKIKEKLPLDSISSSPLERGFLFVGHLVDFLEKHDLSLLYQQNSPETLSNFSKMIAIYIAKQYNDINQINNIDELAEKIRIIYAQYERVKSQLELYKNEITALKPTGSFMEYQQYKRQLALQVLKACTELLLTGVDIAEHYVNTNSGELKRDINTLRTVCNTAIECWFLINDKKYAEAASHLIPMLPMLPIIKVNSSGQFISKFGKLRSVIDLVALSNDSTNLKKVLQNNIVDFEKLNYIASDKQEALQFLIENQLTFLRPLLLHWRENLTLDPRIQTLESFSSIPELASAPKEIKDKLLLLRGPQDKLTFIGEDWKFLNQTPYKELIKARTTIWEVKLPEGLTIADVKEMYEDAISEFRDNSFKIENLIRKICKKATDKAWSDSVEVHIARQILSYFSIDGMDENVKKLVAIAGEISTARTANEVEHVIEKYTLPVASYRIKRSAVNAWMVNAYVGGSASWFLDKDTIGYTLSAPVGIERSWRFKNQSGSFSLFASVIDLGNVINYRFNQSEKSEKTFLLENVISPGLFGVLGLSKRFPLSLGFGYQLNPQRANIFLAFDLPLFRLR